MSFWTRAFVAGVPAFCRPAFPCRGPFISALRSAGLPSGAFMGGVPGGSVARLALGSIKEKFQYMAHIYIHTSASVLLIIHSHAHTSYVCVYVFV